ncbi:hypothetical protein CesoFtcFv8_012582 [Champsocephalus esox]|uniref:Uncharacterized protein n=1 Tax=Champsocephalus esox TaxID=159716 RepID=A0AAN8GVA1_9TELE|nr:hypothetical protein CesoFtcFv8_012582 [Champsocephalus esox]
MQKTFAYRRQEIVHDAPVVAELVNKWPALFTVGEINAEFMRITTLPLQAKFLAELDRYSPNLLKVFHNRGGDAGRKIRLLMAPTARSEDIELKRDSVLKSLCAYLKEDSNSLIKEYLNVRSEEAESAIPRTTMGLYVIRNEGAQEEDGPEDVGVIIEDDYIGTREEEHSRTTVDGRVPSTSSSNPERTPAEESTPTQPPTPSAITTPQRVVLGKRKRGGEDRAQQERHHD